VGVLTVRLGEAEVLAGSLPDTAPVTERVFGESLPMIATATHVRWSGQAAFFTVDDASPLARVTEPEGKVNILQRGMFVYVPEWGDIVMSYGVARLTDVGLPAFGTPLAQVVSDLLEEWAAACSRLLTDGCMRIRIAQAPQGKGSELQGGSGAELKGAGPAFRMRTGEKRPNARGKVVSLTVSGHQLKVHLVQEGRLAEALLKLLPWRGSAIHTAWYGDVVETTEAVGLLRQVGQKIGDSEDAPIGRVYLVRGDLAYHPRLDRLLICYGQGLLTGPSGEELVQILGHIEDNRQVLDLVGRGIQREGSSEMRLSL
jgi:hypothetical protein